MKEGYEYSLTL